MRLQTSLEFKQKKIFALNKKYNVDMFSTAEVVRLLLLNKNVENSKKY